MEEGGKRKRKRKRTRRKCYGSGSGYIKGKTDRLEGRMERHLTK